MNKFNLVKDFSKLFNDKQKDYSSIEPKDYRGYLDQSKTMMIIPKTIEIKELILKLFDVDESPINVDYFYNGETYAKTEIINKMDGGYENVSKFSPDLMQCILKLCLHTKKGSLILKLKKNYPLWCESNNLICILAPRVGDDV